MSGSPLFSQTVIAMVWDFDKTLIPGYMQEPLFSAYGVDDKVFWGEVNALPAKYKRGGVEMISTEILYLNHILDYVRDGRFADLNNARLKQLGAQLGFYPGLPEFFDGIKQRLAANEECRRHGVTLEHYVISTGLRQMILGSAIADKIDGVWGCELLEEGEGESVHVARLGYVLDNTSKTRALFEINKGSNKHPTIDVNATIANEDRRIPFENMIYIADGPSDVPVFSLLNRNGGKTYAVYQRGSEGQFKQVYELQQQQRVRAFGEADYRDGSQTTMWLGNAVEDIAARIVRRREQALGEKLGQPPRHLAE
jgi:hypothetical protein